ncbi:uncharacterized protein BDV14DRAFT_92581 [Aspergillus stella-maris]|uniref:uncharacterized protein n=1 Tax=Aspergillus stella-maris TaxID=1810926 RepID=UPI003CCDA350
MELGLGTLAKLPYDIRHIIWEYVAEGQDPDPDKRPNVGSPRCFLTDYPNLRVVSRQLYEEITNFLFSGCTVTLSFDNKHNIYFFLRRGTRRVKPSSYMCGAVPAPYSRNSDASLLFPVHLFRRIHIHARIPSPATIDDIFNLWTNVNDSVRWFKTAQGQPRDGFALYLPFPKFDSESPKVRGLNYRLFIRPLGQLKRLLLITTEEVVDGKTKGIVRGNVRWYPVKSTFFLFYEPDPPGGGHSLHCELAKDWLNLCRIAATPGECWSTSFLALRPVHLALLSDWIGERPSGRTTFSERFGWIWDSCRQIILEVDPHLSLLIKTRNALRHRSWLTAKQEGDSAYAEHRGTISKLDELTDDIERCLTDCWGWQLHLKSTKGHTERGVAPWPC